MKLEILKGSENYTCQVIKLPKKIPLQGLDNLVEVNYQGNSCLVSKNSEEEILYLFFPAECKLNPEFLAFNNLYRHSELNENKTQKGFFEDSGRVKAIKFKGIISSGFIIPLDSLLFGKLNPVEVYDLTIGDEFNSIHGIEICSKYLKPVDKKPGMSNPKTKVVDSIVESKFVPEHMDTSHLLKNVHKLNLNDYVAITYKLHGTSARFYNTLVQRPLSIKDKVAKFFGVKVEESQYDYVSASRRVVKSVGFEALPNKNHFFTSGDLWSEVGKEYFANNLNKGEAVYCEIIGKTYSGEAIQHGYTYQLEKPKVYIYRISNINEQGIEIDLSYHQMKERAFQLGIAVCPEYFYGTLGDFILKHDSMILADKGIEQCLNDIFYNKLLEKPSILDNNVTEEGFCIRVDKYPKPDIYKIKSKLFLLHEGHLLDKEVVDIETTEAS